MANAQKPSQKKLPVPYSQHNLPNATVTGVNRYREALRKWAPPPFAVAHWVQKSANGRTVLRWCIYGCTV
jgi:hypothetical protein